MLSYSDKLKLFQTKATIETSNSPEHPASDLPFTLCALPSTLCPSITLYWKHQHLQS